MRGSGSVGAIAKHCVALHIQPWPKHTSPSPLGDTARGKGLSLYRLYIGPFFFGGVPSDMFSRDDDGGELAAPGPCHTASLLGDAVKADDDAAFRTPAKGADCLEDGVQMRGRIRGRPPKGAKRHRSPSPGAQSVAPSAVGSGSGAKKAKATRGFIICRGCGKKFDYDSSSTATDVDNDCKRTLDRLREIAKSEGPEAERYFRECFQNDEKLKKLLKAYWAKVGRGSEERGSVENRHAEIQHHPVHREHEGQQRHREEGQRKDDVGT